MRHLPRFQPPSFDNGPLPVPDSPEGTPRDEEPSPVVRPVAQPEQREAHREVPVARGTVIVGSAAPAQTPEVTPVADEAKVDSRTGRFVPGTMVEYKSRTSGQWIVARVEYFEDKSNSYRLDVQPHAHPDRVRARQSSTTSPDARFDRTEPRQDRVLVGSHPSATDGPPRIAPSRSDESPRRQPYPSILPAYAQPTTVVQLQEEDKPIENLKPGVVSQSGHGQADMYSKQHRETDVYSKQREAELYSKQQLHREPEQVTWEPRADPAPLQTNIIQNTIPTPMQTHGAVHNGYPANDPSPASPATKMLKEVVSVNSPREGHEGVEMLGDAGRTAEIERYRQEAESLRRQVSRLQTENGVLKERLSAEAALKDRYFAELCICNEQLQRLRTTPR